MTWLSLSCSFFFLSSSIAAGDPFSMSLALGIGGGANSPSLGGSGSNFLPRCACSAIGSARKAMSIHARFVTETSIGRTLQQES